MSSLYDIDVAACRGRQKRVLAEMERLKLDLVIVSKPEHVQWLAGPRFSPMLESVAALDHDGHLTLVSPGARPEVAAADDSLHYDAAWLCTMRNDQREACSAVLLAALANRAKPKRIGVEFSCFSQHLAGPLNATLVDIEPDLYRLRRRKDADELARIKKAIAGTGAMYRKAREIIKPGISEIMVFNELQAAAVREFGEMLTGTGNDYACAVLGGAPRDRKANAGELYILDLGPAFRGYFADNCRVISADGKPADRQLAAWQTIADVFPMIEREVRPGKRCRELFAEAKEMIGRFPGGTWHAHLGHGIGLYPHEAPHLNPNWDDVFEVGDVIAVEPAVYADDLKAGIRLENNYLVTPTGVELLSDFPLEL
ncbi:MAG: Xaa-Pro peptidase family protein [Planctomycetota bacterium]|nr:Xaa-Pro peptidase family protein [Planctomycetota bacterium]